MYTTKSPGARVEKLMSFTRTEFEHGLERLLGAKPVLGEKGYDLSAAAFGLPVTCSFEPQPDAVLGGRVRLPRVKVALDFSRLNTEERLVVLDRFEKVFQRGGG